MIICYTYTAPQQEVVTGFLIFGLALFTIFSLKLRKLLQTTQIIYTLKRSNPKKSFHFLGLPDLSLPNGIQEADGRTRLEPSSIPFSSTKDNKRLGGLGCLTFLFLWPSFTILSLFASKGFETSTQRPLGSWIDSRCN
jgi:hypothetical protein